LWQGWQIGGRTYKVLLDGYNQLRPAAQLCRTSAHGAAVSESGAKQVVRDTSGIRQVPEVKRIL
jgi:hypothetical protein